MTIGNLTVVGLLLRPEANKRSLVWIADVLIALLLLLEILIIWVWN